MEIQNVYKYIDEADAILFLQSLIQLNTVNPPGMEKRVADLISLRLSHTDLLIHSDVVEKDRENLIVSYTNQDALNNNSKTLIFSGHFDTVPVGNVDWSFPVFEGKRLGNRIYGRGSSDMKSGVAAMVLAIECIKRSGIKLNGSIQFIGTVGEEVNCIGAKTVVKKGQIDQATAIVISEPTSNQVVIAHKGALWLEINIYGKTAHGSMPSQGINAISAMNVFMNELNNFVIRYDHHDILGDSTINIGMIKGGVGPNVVPDQCTITLDVRTVPGQEHQEIIDDVNELLNKVAVRMNVSYVIDVINDMQCTNTPSGHPFINLARDIVQTETQRNPSLGGVNYYTDGSIYRKHLPHVPILIFGPGEPKLAHQPDEWVDMEKYLESIRFYISLAISYLR